MSSTRIFESSFETQDPANITYQINPPISDGINYEVALIGGILNNSIPNISSNLSNNTFRYSNNNGTTWFVVNLGKGLYAVEDINKELKKALVLNGHYGATYPIEFNISLYYLKVTLRIDANYQVDFTISKLWQLLGFNNQVYTAGSFVAPQRAKIGDATKFLYIKTNIVDQGQYVNSSLKNGVIKVVEGGAFGSSFSLRNNSDVYDYYPVNKYMVTDINFQLLDVGGNIVDTNGESTTYILKFRPRQL